MIVITAPTQLREQRRRVARDSRDDRLLPDREKIERADYHYVNTGTFEDLDRWVMHVMEELTGAARADARSTLMRARAIVVCGGARCARRGSARGVAVGARLARSDPLPAPLRGDRHDTRAQLRPRPGAPRRRDLHREPVSRRCALVRGRARADATAPETGRAIALRTGGDRFVVSDLLDPEINVRYGSWYLRELTRKYGSTRTALAAYHAGQGNVDRWREQGVGIQFPETRAYVDDVLDAASGLPPGLQGRARPVATAAGDRRCGHLAATRLVSRPRRAAPRRAGRAGRNPSRAARRCRRARARGSARSAPP